MHTKMLFNFKKETHARLMISYLGARTLQPSITKTSIVSSLIDNSIINLPCTVSNKGGKILTFSDLYNLGIDLIKTIFNDTLAIEKDSNFLDLLNSFNIKNMDFNEENGRIIVEKLLSINLDNKITSSDVDVLANIIYPLGIYEEEDCYLRVFKGSLKDYWVFDQVNLIIDRYKKLSNDYNYYNILTEFIFNELEKMNFSSNYKFVSEGNTLAEHLDSQEFNKEFFEMIYNNYCPKSQTFNLIYNSFSSDNIEFLKHYSLKLINSNNYIDYEHYNFKSDLYYLIIDDLKKIISNVLYLNFKEYLEGSIFQCFESLIYRKYFIETLMLKSKNGEFDYNRIIKISKIHVI